MPDVFRGTYREGFAPRDFEPRHPGLWKGCIFAACPSLGPTGATLFDWSAAKAHGTLNNFTLSTAIAPSGGQYSISCDGSDDYISSPFTGLSGLARCSVSYWIKRTGTGTLGPFMGQWDNPATQWEAQPYSDNNIYFVIGSTWGFCAFTATDWTHFAFIFDGTQGSNATRLKIAINGIYQSLSFSGTIPASIQSITNGIEICRSARGAGGYGTGAFDDVRIFNRAILPQEVALLSRRRGIAYEYERPNRLMTTFSARSPVGRLIQVNQAPQHASTW